MYQDLGFDGFSLVKLNIKLTKFYALRDHPPQASNSLKKYLSRVGPWRLQCGFLGNRGVVGLLEAVNKAYTNFSAEE